MMMRIDSVVDAVDELLLFAQPISAFKGEMLEGFSCKAAISSSDSGIVGKVNGSCE